MKKRFCFLLALFLLFQGNIVLAASYENPDLVEWEAGYLQSLDVERIYAATSTSDGNILIAGQVETKGFMIYDPIVIKMTPDGKILWSKLCYPDVKNYSYISESAFVSAITEAGDGGIFLAISHDVFDKDEEGGLKRKTNTRVMKLDKNGNVKWEREFGGDKNTVPIDIIPTDDGGCLVAGESNSTKGEVSGGMILHLLFHRYFALKLDANGNKQWAYVYGPGGGESLIKVTATKDGGYMLLGESLSDLEGSGIKHHGSIDVWVVKVDKNGKELWNRTYGGSEIDGLSGAAPCDGGVILAAATNSTDGDVTNKDPSFKNWLFIIDENGKIIWERYYGEDVIFRPQHIIQMPGGDYVMTGRVSNFTDIAVLRFSKDGKLLWKEDIPDKFFCESLAATPDGGFILVGQRPGRSYTDDTGYVIKFKPDQKDIDALESLKPYVVKYEDYAIRLSKIDVFRGTGDGFALERMPTRLEASVMFVRLLGGEKEALEKHYEHPFTDVPAWGNDYVGYLYHYGLTKGTGPNTFSPSDAINANSYFTFLLRALGYSDSNGDFVWNRSLEFGRQMSLLSEADYNELTKHTFYRDHLARVSYLGLKMRLKNGGTLVQKLIDSSAVDRDIAREVGLID